MAEVQFNLKNFVYIKYIFTVYNFFLFLIGIFLFLKSINIMFKNNLETLNKLIIVLLVFAFIFGACYLSLRFFIHSKSGYKYKKRDNIFNISWMFLMILGFLIILILIILFYNTSISSFKISWYLLFPILISGFIGGSILESISVIPELSFASIKNKKSQRELQVKENKNKKVKESNTDIIEGELSKENNPFLKEETEND